MSEELERRITERAVACGIVLDASGARALAVHARAVLEAAERLSLTTVREIDAVLVRHIGESLVGAAALEPDMRGRLVDLGSGNGYPGIPVAVARAGLGATLVEAAVRKADFLRDTIRAAGLTPRVEVHQGQVQRPADLGSQGPIDVLTSRAMGGWERAVPRFAPVLSGRSRVLLWAGEEAETIFRRVAWRRLELERRLPLPGRDRSWVFVLRRR